LKCKNIIFDLENSIAKEDYGISIKNIIKYFNTVKDNKKYYIRIDADNYKTHIDDTKNLPISGYMIPKISLNSVTVLEYINSISKYNNIILIEDIKAFVNISKIYQERYNIEYIVFGGEDYCLDFNCKRNNNNLFFPRIKILEFCKTNDIKAIDTVYPYIYDNEVFLDEVTLISDMGFDGKMLFYPKQLEIMNDYIKKEKEEIIDIINKFESSSKEGNTVLNYNGRIFERNHINKFKSIIHKNKIG